MREYDDDVRYVCSSCGSEYAHVPKQAECLDCGARVLDLDGHEVEHVEPGARDDEVVVAPFETDNPWLHRVFEHRAFGRAPAAASALLAEVSADPDEVLLMGLRVRHGSLRAGYLLLTTHGMRWVQTLPIRATDYWPLESRVELGGMLGGGGVLHFPTGHQFQGWWRQCKAFVECLQLAQQAATWGEATAQEERPPASGLADEIGKLAELHRAGVLTTEEFTLAKAKLLS